VESRGMAWNQHQQCARMSPADDSMSLENRLFLSRMGAARHPHGPRWRVKLTQLATTLAHVAGNTEIEFDVARPMRAVGIGAQRLEPLRTPFPLGSDDDSTRKRIAKQRAQAPVAADGTRRDARAGQDQGNAPAAALMIQVGPQLGLENHCQARLRAI